MNIKQSIPNGSLRKLYDLSDWDDESIITTLTPIASGDFVASNDADLIIKQLRSKYENKPVRVLSLETYTSLGDRNYEYYNIELEPGLNLIGISGYHLKPLKNK